MIGEGAQQAPEEQSGYLPLFPILSPAIQCRKLAESQVSQKCKPRVQPCPQLPNFYTCCVCFSLHFHLIDVGTSRGLVQVPSIVAIPYVGLSKFADLPVSTPALWTLGVLDLASFYVMPACCRTLCPWMKFGMRNDQSSIPVVERWDTFFDMQGLLLACFFHAF